MNGLALARASESMRAVEQRLAQVQPLEPQGPWWRIFAAVSDDPDFEYLILDSKIMRTNQYAAGQKVSTEPSDLITLRSRGTRALLVMLELRASEYPFLSLVRSFAL